MAFDPKKLKRGIPQRPTDLDIKPKPPFEPENLDPDPGATPVPSPTP